MNHDPGANRHYNTSQLPTLKTGAEDHPRKDVLFKLYGEICSSWRMMTDVRFKLMGLIPIISGVILLSLLGRDSGATAPAVRFGIALFGLLVTVGLYIYDQRNSELYNDLISRGRKIEEELGIDTGQFLGRPQPSRRLINHSNATNLIYGSSIAGWLFVFAVILMSL